MSNLTLAEMEKEFGPVTITKTPNEVKKSVNNITSEKTTPSTPVTPGSQEAINRRNTIKIDSFDKDYNKFIELYNKLKEKSASPETKIPQLQSDYYVLQKKKNATMASYNNINRDEISVRGRSSINAKKSDITSKLAEIRGNIEKRQRAILPGRRAPINPLTKLQPSPTVHRQTTLRPGNNTNITANSPMRIMNNINNSTPPASAAVPSPIPTPPPAPPVSITQMPSNTAISAKTVEFREKAQKYRNLLKRMKTNTRKKNNTNALNNHSLASLYPNMNSFEEQSASVNAPQPNNSNSITAGASNTLANIERRLGANNKSVLYPTNSTQSNENLFRSIHTTANELKRVASGKPQNKQNEQQPVQYIKLVNGTTYKFIEITNDNKAKVQKLDRITKTWGAIEDLTDEQVAGFTEVKCPPSQAGGRRTRRHRRQRKQRKTRRA